jgi:hypothetical protein
MAWKISVGRAGGGNDENAGDAMFSVSLDTTISGRTAAQVRFFPNAGRTTPGTAGSNPACRPERVRQNVLSILVGTD